MESGDQQLGDEQSELLPDDVLSDMIEELCRSKAEEFQMIGYKHVSGPDVWECVKSKHKKQFPPPLHQLVNDIMSLKVVSMMNWLTIRAYKGRQS